MQTGGNVPDLNRKAPAAEESDPKPGVIPLVKRKIGNDNYFFFPVHYLFFGHKNLKYYVGRIPLVDPMSERMPPPGREKPAAGSSRFTGGYTAS
jgi:hypothetical protein